MSVVSKGIGMKMSNHRMTPQLHKLCRHNVQVIAQQCSRNSRARNHFLAFASGKQCAAAPLLRTVAAEQTEICGAAIQHDPLAGSLRSFYDHVHAVCVTGEVTEVHNYFTAYRLAFQAEQFSMM